MGAVICPRLRVHAASACDEEGEVEDELETAKPDDDTVAVPSPDEIMSDFESVDFVDQPYAEVMLRTGTDDKNNAEIIFRCRSVCESLAAAADALSLLTGTEAQWLREFQAAPGLLESITFDCYRWHGEVVPRYQAVLDALASEDRSRHEVAHMRELLSYVGKSIWMDVRTPRYDYYMCMLDEMVSRYDRGDRSIEEVPLDSVKMLQCVDMALQQKNADFRKQCLAEFLVRMYERGLAGRGHWKLNDLLCKHADVSELKRISLSKPLLCFRLNLTDASEPGVVVLEGNARLAALNAALDLAREKYPDFTAPVLEMSVVSFSGSPQAQRNLAFFLDLTWKCSFPDVPLWGWRPQVRGSVRKVSPDAIKACPRYFGYTPTGKPTALAALGLESLATTSKAALLASPLSNPTFCRAAMSAPAAAGG